MPQWRRSKRLWDKKIEKATRFKKDEEPKLKSFTPKNGNVEILENYGKVLSDSYWEKWDSSGLGLVEKEKVAKTCQMLKDGANIGVSGEGRWATEGPNSSRIYDYGVRVADSLQTAVNDGIMYGPLKRSEIPWTSYTVSPMTVGLKANGAARIIMNLSYPHEPILGRGEACSPNEGMRCFEEFEKVTMGSDSKWRMMMHRAGRPCEMIKADWDMAYKHVSVCWGDHSLQVVEFGGRFFIEKCLTFGGGSSPTLYHMPASLLITMAEVESGFPHDLNLMQLDDNCACDRKGSVRLRSYRSSYRALARELGVRLASEDNPSKAFSPTTKGEILGLIYDGEAWTWEIPADKMARLLVLLGKGVRQGCLTNGEAMTLSGKLTHYGNIVRGRYERCFITHMVQELKAKGEIVKVSRRAAEAMTWWILNLRASSLEGSFITDPTGYFPARALQLFPDAAGGATESKVKGWGCVCPDLKEHAHGVWPEYILRNTRRSGQTWGRRLSVLEGFGAAQCVAIWAKEIVAEGAAAIYVDNSGFVYASENGISKCEYIYTLAKFIQDMASGMGVSIKLYTQGAELPWGRGLLMLSPRET